MRFAGLLVMAAVGANRSAASVNGELVYQK